MTLEHDYFAARTTFLQNQGQGIINIEQSYMRLLLTIIRDIAPKILADFIASYTLKPFWINYAPRQRGRAPTGLAVPWGEVGEKTIGAHLIRAIAEQHPATSYPGLPIGGDLRWATSDALIHFDVKMTGPNDNANELVVSSYQISGDGAEWQNGIRNSPIIVQGLRSNMNFQPQLPPLYVLNHHPLLCLTYFLKVVYSVNELGNQPLTYLELACVPNGLLLYADAGPRYSDMPGLFIPGKDDRTIQREKRARVRLQPLAKVASWRCAKIMSLDTEPVIVERITQMPLL